MVELSSFHIADLASGPRVVVLTNLFAEHADWHGSADAYRAEKLRILGLDGVRTAVLRPAGSWRWRTPIRACGWFRYGVDGGWEAGEREIAAARRADAGARAAAAGGGPQRAQPVRLRWPRWKRWI